VVIGSRTVFSPFRKNLLKKFSARIRSQKALIYQAVVRCSQDPNFPFELFAGRLCDHSSFALKLLQRVQETAPSPLRLADSALQGFTERVRAQRQVVHVYVRQNGLLLKDAAVSLQGDKKIVLTACKNDYLALLHCAPGETRDALFSDKTFILDIFDWVASDLVNRPGGKYELYRMLAVELKKDPKVRNCRCGLGGKLFGCGPTPRTRKQRWFLVDHGLGAAGDLFEGTRAGRK